MLTVSPQMAAVYCIVLYIPASSRGRRWRRRARVQAGRSTCRRLNTSSTHRLTSSLYTWG